MVYDHRSIRTRLIGSAHLRSVALELSYSVGSDSRWPIRSRAFRWNHPSVETGHTNIVVQVCYLHRPTCWIGGGSQYKILVAFSGAAGHRIYTLDYGRFETFACKPIKGPLRVLFHNVVQNADDLFIGRIDLIHDTH